MLASSHHCHLSQAVASVLRKLPTLPSLLILCILIELPIETRETAVSRKSPLSPSSSLSSSAERHLRINKLSVPESVENGTKKFVILDCDYDVNERVDKKLVIKWFFNDDPVPIYQWIPELNIRTTSPKFTDRIDLSYSVPGGSPLTKYRAVKLLKPTISDSGRYSCHVASLFSQDSQEKSMHVYAPIVWTRKPTDVETTEGMDVSIGCKAEGDPPPQIFWKRLTGSSSINPPLVSSEVLRIKNIRREDAGIYSCVAWNGNGPQLEVNIRVSVKATTPQPHQLKPRGNSAQVAKATTLSNVLSMILLFVFLYTPHL